MIEFVQGGIKMKLRYPVFGIIILLISATVWQTIVGTDTFESVGQPIFDTLLLVLLGLIAYCVAKIVFNELFDMLGDTQQHFEHKERRKEQQAYMLHNINKELDEIEASLDAVTNSEKVTPIWEIPPKKP